MKDQALIRGNWLTLIGVAWYLLEFIAIALYFKPLPPDGSSIADFTAYYQANLVNILMYVVGVSAAILGRLAYISGLRSAMRSFDDCWSLMDLAFALSLVAVAVETVGMGMIAMAPSLADYPLQDSVMLAAAFQNAAAPLQELVSISFALVALAASIAMLRSRSFPAWVNWVGLAGGVLHLLSVNAGYFPASLMPVREVGEFFGWILIVTWMLATGIFVAKSIGSNAAQISSNSRILLKSEETADVMRRTNA